jgi:hypothetical protein
MTPQQIDDLGRGIVAALEAVIAVAQQGMAQAVQRDPVQSRAFVEFLQQVVANKDAFADQILVKCMMEHPDAESLEL